MGSASSRAARPAARCGASSDAPDSAAPSTVVIAALRRKVLGHYRRQGRDLPWRNTTDPYAILVSEVMLQQTQVERVIAYWRRWMKRLPTLERCARCRPASVLKLWSGLGYNSRALRLRGACRQILALHQGKVPMDETALIALPGIGVYTARAILAFAFNQDVAVIDTNVRRVLLHELVLGEDVSAGQLEEIALRCIPRGHSRDWHNALMDYGAMVATSSSTGIKPLSRQSRFEGSDRQVRGAIVRMLAAQGECLLDELRRQWPGKDVSAIAARLQREGLVRLAGTRIRLP